MSEPRDSQEIDLSSFDDDFASAPVEERQHDEVPDGKFQVVVDRVELTTAKSSGSPMLKWTLKILGPTHAGRLLWRNNVMASRENLKWLKQDLHTCGLDLQKVSDLPGNLGRLLDVQLEVVKRTRGENTNIYFNKRLFIDALPSSGSRGDGPGGDGDLPQF